MHLDASDLQALTQWLRQHELITPHEAVGAVERAGEGNMNLVLRVSIGTRSLIVKQARPWVERYPEIAAPVSRTEVEAAIYAAASRAPDLVRRMPKLLAHFPAEHVLVMEDLGPTSDCSDLYGARTLRPEDLEQLLTWLRILHDTPVSQPFQVLYNRDMRALNHEHIFSLPFRPNNGLDLDAITPGLGAVARDLSQDADLVARIRRLGEIYLADGETLLHGDFYPGSWVHTNRGLVVLDVEFGFLGDPAWDYGVLLGHLLLSGHEDAVLQSVLQVAPPGTRGFAGVEVLRRLLGVAQLPVFVGLPTKQAWLGRALGWIHDET